jgi:cysteine desulfurase
MGTAPLYFDYQATTPVDPDVLSEMLVYFTEKFGNAASRSHPYGWEAEEAVAHARSQVADLLGSQAKEIIFTSGATESNNLIIKGVARALRAKGKHIVTGATEHKAVLDACAALEKEGFHITVLPCDTQGNIAPEAIEKAIRDDTILVSLMHANNEVGTVHPVAAYGAICRARNVFFHTDAVQSVGVLPMDVEQMNVDAASISAHKIYGPKGIGALYLRRKSQVRPEPLFHGGGHERGHRSGTLDVPSIVGFGAACALAKEQHASDGARILALRQRLLMSLRELISDLVVHGTLENRLPGNLSLGFPQTGAEEILLKVQRRLALSSGSACSSASPEPSHVLRALRVPNDLSHCSVRLGIGRHTTETDVDEAVAILSEAIIQIRQESPVFEAG